MSSKILLPIAFAALWACGGSTFTGPLPDDGGSSGSGGSGSSSGGGSGSSSGSSSGGGSGSSSGSSSGGSSGGSSGSSSGSSSGGPCPANPPTNAASCPTIGLDCEYGSNPNPSCNELAECEATGWTFSPIGPPCPTGMCPATYADVPKNKTCSPDGLDCAYPEGECNCTGDVEIAGPNPQWQCTTPAGGCPEPRPRIGSACTQPNLSCDYGACAGGVAVECQNGVWTQEGVACPGFVQR
jgi:hypothetical protein